MLPLILAAAAIGGLLCSVDAAESTQPTVKVFKVAVVLDAPFFLTSDAGNYVGVLPTAVEGVLKALNSDPRTNATTVYEAEWEVFPNYTACSSAILSGAADFGGVGVTSVFLEQNLGVFSTPFYTMSLVMASIQEPEHPHTWIVLQPFTFASWLVFATWIFATALAMFWTDRLSPLGSAGHGAPLPAPLSLWGLFGTPNRPLLPCAVDVAAAEAEEKVNEKIEKAHRGSFLVADGDVDVDDGSNDDAAAAMLKHDKPDLEGGDHGHSHGHSDSHGHGHGHGNEHHGAAHFTPTLFDTAVGSLEFEFERHFPRPTSSRFILIFWRVLIFFLLALYESSLNAIEVSLETQSTGLTLTQVQQQQLPWGTLSTSVNRFTSSSSFALRQMAISGAMKIYSTTDDLIAGLDNGEIVAAFRLDAVLRYAAAGDESCDLNIDVSANVGKAQVAFLFPPSYASTPFLAVVNEAITEMQAAQELTEAVESAIKAAGSCTSAEIEPVAEAESGTIQLGSLLGAFVVAGVVLVLGWLAFLGEWMLHWGCFKCCGFPRPSDTSSPPTAQHRHSGHNDKAAFLNDASPNPSRGDRVMAMASGAGAVVVSSSNPLA